MTRLARARDVLERLTLYIAVTQALGVAATRRLLRGGRHPSWPLSYELAMTALRVAATEHHQLATRLAREQVAPLPRALAGRVRVDASEIAGLYADIHTPNGWSERAPTLLYLHGGGYVTCSPRSHRDVVARIADATGARCIAPDYRLAPAHPFPAARDDALACYGALLADGVAPSSLFVGGDSAGGGLALSLLLALRDADQPLPRAALLLSPWVDLTLRADDLTRSGPLDYVAAQRLADNARSYAADVPLDDPGISPVFADLAGLPPLLIQSGEWEMLCPQNQQLATRARAAGVEVLHEVEPGMLHAFTCFAGILPQGVAALTSLGRYVRARTTGD